MCFLLKANALLLLLIGLVACSTFSQQPATYNVELTRIDNRLGISALQLGDQNATLIQNAKTHYSATPRCEDRRVAIANTRKAFGLTICEYKPESQTIHSTKVIRVVTYTLDDTLVRLDVDASGDNTAFENSLAAIEANWRAGQRRAVKASNREEIVWQAGSDELAVSRQPTANIIEYRIRDFRLAEKLPWLMQ